ncbi:hypothetical protein HPB50_014359 [Hyalomma asiaticum]|uniref:Uncharacterized protein n=1 Tax=Hyalomma asiaticum TaxID=266040 RepID=A0ACB7T881_HYAAI|nr:hypothetical protein HPB50_014359 [Hyalomma asiaticum]
MYTHNHLPTPRRLAGPPASHSHHHDTTARATTPPTTIRSSPWHPYRGPTANGRRTLATSTVLDQAGQPVSRVSSVLGELQPRPLHGDRDHMTPELFRGPLLSNRRSQEPEHRDTSDEARQLRGAVRGDPYPRGHLHRSRLASRALRRSGNPVATPAMVEAAVALLRTSGPQFPPIGDIEDLPHTEVVPPVVPPSVPEGLIHLVPEE